MYIIDSRRKIPAILYNPERDLQTNDYLLTFKRLTHPATYEAIFRRGRDHIEAIVQAKCNQIVWTSTGALYGYKNRQPHAHVLDFWEAIKTAWDEGIEGQRQIDRALKGRACVITAGSIVKVLIGERTEKYWIAYKTETEIHDIVTGKVIWRNEYFISDTFVPPHIPRKSSLSDLGSAFNSRRMS